MEGTKSYIQLTVPICPKCNALLRLRLEHNIFRCNDCGTTFEIVGEGMRDTELEVQEKNVFN